MSGMHINNNTVAKFIVQLRRYVKKNKGGGQDMTAVDFIDFVMESLAVNFEVDETDLKRIPAKGAFLTVSNQAFGGIDGLLLLKIFLEKRPDFKLLTHSDIHEVEPLQDITLPINKKTSSRADVRLSAIEHALDVPAQGGALGLFPAGDIARKRNSHSDRKWQSAYMKLIQKAQVSVVPVYFQGNNGWVYQLFGSVVNLLKNNVLPKDNFAKKQRNIKVRIGNPIPKKEWDEFKSIEQVGRFLRAKTYALGTSLEVKKIFRPKLHFRSKKVEPIAPPAPHEALVKEMNGLKEKYYLFTSGNFDVVCAPSPAIPLILMEIGRLREITFREVGEGTNQSRDTDDFDFFFHHLIIWDHANEKIVGSYRVGRGDEIMHEFKVQGFYIRTLFKIKKEFYPILEQSLELGRSFIVKEYQRKPLSLFLLWKGILYYLLKNKEYRYLIGPASISNDFSKFSKSLIISFFQKNFYDEEFAKYISPRKKFKIKDNPNFDNEMFIKSTDSNVKKLDKFIQDIEPDYSTPVLFKKYIQLNAKLLGFNVDPKFNNCLDGLILLDIFDVPLNTLEALSKELEDKSILERFNF